MKLSKMLMAFLLFLLVPSFAVAGDFDWTRDFNVRAEADPSGFRASLATRFHIGDAQVGLVLNNVQRLADAYIVLRLVEMSAKPPDYVIEQYKAGKGKGWGVIAKNLGIKPGSQEFHALKRGSDLYDDRNAGKGKGKDKGKSKGKGKE